MNEKRESSATIDRKKKYPRCSQSKVTIGKNDVAYNNSDVARGRISPVFPKINVGHNYRHENIMRRQ